MKRTSSSQRGRRGRGKTTGDVFLSRAEERKPPEEGEADDGEEGDEKRGRDTEKDFRTPPVSKGERNERKEEEKADEEEDESEEPPREDGEEVVAEVVGEVGRGGV